MASSQNKMIVTSNVGLGSGSGSNFTSNSTIQPNVGINSNTQSMIIDHDYEWDPSSAMNKLLSDLSVSVGIGIVSVSKQITGPNDPEKDAYRNCTCGQHKNKHKH